MVKIFKLILISPPEQLENETEIVNELFTCGLEIFHLRKPNYLAEQYIAYLDKINSEFLDRIMIHRYKKLFKIFSLRGFHYQFVNFPIKKIFPYKISCSCHSWKEFMKIEKKVNYAFISPFFNSISKKNYLSNRKLWEIPEGLNLNKAIILGGVSLLNISKTKMLNIGGVAVLGSIWKNKDPVKAFLQLKNAL